ncbi:MAG: response regulator transcription factor [Chloroflexi bacterium]|nr:response regulator transcription factor [Chloroflexota bacterium]
MANELILVVDDEPSIVQLARLYLERDGFRILAVPDGPSALDAVHSHKPALVVLDVMLPGFDGLEVCRRMRSVGNDTPIIMLTARDEDVDKIIGLELGADDYLSKPFNPRELLARVKAILRRSGTGRKTVGKLLHRGDLTIDPGSREVSLCDQRLHLRAQEFDLLLTLAGQPGRVFTREQLLEMAWGFEFYGQTRTVDVHIAHLRKKLEGASVRIETVTGVGYKFVL